MTEQGVVVGGAIAALSVMGMWAVADFVMMLGDKKDREFINRQAELARSKLMSSRRDADPRDWKTFWSSVAKDGTRYRHQVRLHRNGNWAVRTEVVESDTVVPYYTVEIPVPPGHGKEMFNRRHSWTNIDEDTQPMYPSPWEHGFINLEDSNAN